MGILLIGLEALALLAVFVTAFALSGNYVIAGLIVAAVIVELATAFFCKERNNR